MQAFRYPHLLAQNMQLLTHGIRERDTTLSLVRKALSNTETALANMNRDLVSSYKMIMELEASLNEAHKGSKKAQNNLLKMHSKNNDLSK